MDIEEYQKLARNKMEADSLIRQVRDVIKTTKWQKQDMREGFKETFKPLIKSQDSIKKSIDEQQNTTIAQLKANQLALTQGLNQNRMAITEGFDKLDEVKKWDLAQLPGFEAIEEPKEDEEEDEEDEEVKEVLPSTSDEKPKIAKFTPEDLNRYLLSKETQDILKSSNYDNLPSYYLQKDNSTIDKLIEEVSIDLNSTKDLLKNTADIYRNEEGYYFAKTKSENPKRKTIENVKKFNALSTYATNLSILKLYKTKSGSGMIYFNNPHQLLDRLELLGGSILAGNNGVIPEFSQIAHLLNQMKVISKKQLNDLLKIGEPTVPL